jgi:hypothetical protein
MNTGIADAVDLGWKLAATLNGWGGSGLLPSYDAERRPIGIRNVNKSTEFHLEEQKHGNGTAAIEEDSIAGAQVRARVGEALVRDVGRMWRTPGLQIGYRYEDSPICVPDGTPPYPDNPADFIASSRPGSRAPHVWLGDGRSTLDLFGRGFVLLCLGASPPEIAEIELAAAARGVPLEVAKVTQPDTMELYQHRLVLVRPDGHVAWRADEPPRDAGAIIDQVRGARVRERHRL